MGQPAARLTDMHTCPMQTPAIPTPIPHVGGPVSGPGKANVLIGKMPAAVVGDMCVCVGPPDSIVKGSATVMIGGMPAARMGDSTAHGGSIAIGCPTVLIGGSLCMIEDNSFLGNGWAFPPEFRNHETETKMVSDDADIHESLFIILTTSPGERVMNPEFGCGIKSMVFDTLSESLLTILKDMIKKSILFFEPRITLEAIEIDTDNEVEGILHINLVYTIRMTNTRSNMVYPYYFNEGTNIQQM